MIQLLDHGYLKIIPKGCWGSDELIIESARMSTDGAFRGWGPLICSYCDGRGHYLVHTSKSISPMSLEPQDIKTCEKCKGTGQVEGDEKLLRFLWEKKHSTPFEMAGAMVEIQAPIMVFREWHRHRTQSYSELSARYTELPDMFYTPSLTRLRFGGHVAGNRQSSGSDLGESVAERAQDEIRRASADSRESYRSLLDLGVARELARLVVPVNQYSRMRASANLRNWLAFLELRMAPGAQFEIREYANALHVELGKLFPRTLSLFNGD